MHRPFKRLQQVLGACVYCWLDEKNLNCMQCTEMPGQEMMKIKCTNSKSQDPKKNIRMTHKMLQANE